MVDVTPDLAPREHSRLPALPSLRDRRDGILPTTAAALSVPGLPQALTATASRTTDPPPPHPLVREAIDDLGVARRERHLGRCPEVALLSRRLTQAGAQRAGQARRALKGAVITARHIREDGDPQHGAPAPHCRSCTALLDRFQVRGDTADPGDSGGRQSAFPLPGQTDVSHALDLALAAAGGRPGRRRTAWAEHWADTLSAHRSPQGHPHALFPAAFEAWAEFGGLSLEPVGPGRDCAPVSVELDPLRGLHWARTLADLGRALGTALAPLGGETAGTGLLALDREGRLYCLDHSGDWYLGPDPHAGLAALLTGLHPLRLAPPRRPV